MIMTDSGSKQSMTVQNVAQVVVNHVTTGPGAASLTTSNAIAIVDNRNSTAGQKKSGFVITKVDKASNSMPAENESDLEAELNDHNAYNVGSPDSCQLSDVSIVDGGSLERPLSIVRAPPPTPAGATPTSPAWPLTQQQRPSGITAVISASSAVAGAAALLTAAANIEQTPSQQPQMQQAVVIASPTATSAPSAIHRECSATSRFHIIKIETGPYKRGRWNCRDFDESASATANGGILRSDMITVGPRSGSSSNSSARPSYHIVAEENGHVVAGDQQTLLLLTAPPSSSEHQSSHQPNAQASVLTARPPLPTGHHHHQPTHQSSHGGQPSKSTDPSTSTNATNSNAPPLKDNGISKQTTCTQQTSVLSTLSSLSNIAQQDTRQRSQSPGSVPPSAPVSAVGGRFHVQRNVDLNNCAAAILDSIVGSMQHDNKRLVIGTATNRQDTVGTACAVAGATSTDGPITSNGNAASGQAATGAGSGSVGANVVAIDNKIEQAMDLVKTHLLYAVREEVEVLKEKIIDLEKKVFRLETENKLLREYAPPEILQQIQHQHHAQAVGASTSSLSAVQSSASLPTSTTIHQTWSSSQLPQQHQSTTLSTANVSTWTSPSINYVQGLTSVNSNATTSIQSTNAQSH